MKDTIINTNPPVISDEKNEYAFISYSHKDKNIVYKDLWELHEKGFAFWYDDGITAGNAWNEAVKNVIDSPLCKVAIFFFSENTVISSAIHQEMELVKQLGKPFFVINITDRDISDIVAQALSNKQINFSDMALLANFLNEKIIYVNRSEKEYMNKVVRHCIQYNLQAKVEIVTVKHTSKKILIICKSSSFSNSIINGVYDYFSAKDQITIDKKLIDKNLSRFEATAKFYQLLVENVDSYDGFILRVPDKYNEQLIDFINKMTKLDKKIVLLDIEPSAEKFSNSDVPSYVGSDFVTGGVLLGERIGDLATKFGVNKSTVVLFEGPYANNSAKIRCDSIYQKIISTSPNASILRYTLPSLTASMAINYIKEQAIVWERTNAFVDKTVIFFAGIDNIAVEVMRIMAKNEDFSILNKVLKSAKKVIIAGYDGIRDANNEVILKNYGVDFVTIDVVPFKQGINAGEKMYSLLFENATNGRVLTQPELVEHIKFPQEKYGSLKDIQFLLNNKKCFIFDLDGTIADTETLHWEAYNVLLEELGVHLTNEYIQKYIGHSEISIYQMIKSDFDIDFNDEAFLQRRIEIYLDLVAQKKLSPYPFIYEILENLKVPSVIVTSQIPPVVNRLLELWGLDSYFPQEVRFCCHDGTYNKRDVYKNIGVYIGMNHTLSPGEIVLFEDSLHYLTEGQRLGFTTVGVEHKYNRNSLKNCDAIMSSNINRGAFVGLCGLDVVYYGFDEIPEENTKRKIVDFSVAIGGPAANAAITYAKLGGEAYLVTRIGESPEGILIKSKLKELNVKVVDLEAGNGARICNISSVYVNQSTGTRTIFSGQNSTLNVSALDFEDIIKKVDFVLYDGNFPQAENNLIRYVEYYDKDLVIDAGSFKQGFPECFYRATSVISSETFVDPDKNDVFALQQKYGFSYAAKTRGEKSVIYDNGNTRGEIALLPAVKVVDSLGAGDVFHGAFCYFFYAKKMNFEQSLEMASRVATLSVTQKGVVNGINYAMDGLN